MPSCDDIHSHRVTNVLEALQLTSDEPYGSEHRQGYQLSLHHEFWRNQQEEYYLPFRWKGTSIFKKIRPSQPVVLGLSVENLSDQSW